MTADWRATARKAGFRLSATDGVVVSLDGGNKQSITFAPDPAGAVLRARTIIARKAILEATAPDSSPLRYAWERNRLSDLLCLTVDGYGRLVGEVSIPLVGLEPDEFAFYVQELARISDWHEFRLSGEDRY